MVQVGIITYGGSGIGSVHDAKKSLLEDNRAVLRYDEVAKNRWKDRGCVV
jgi:hypothetical protein